MKKSGWRFVDLAQIQYERWREKNKIKEFILSLEGSKDRMEIGVIMCLYVLTR